MREVIHKVLTVSSYTTPVAPGGSSPSYKSVPWCICAGLGMHYRGIHDPTDSNPGYDVVSARSLCAIAARVQTVA